MYNTDQYLRMIEKFNRMSFADQMETVKNNPTILKLTIQVSIKGISPEAEEDIRKTNWLKINHSEL